MTQTEYFSLQGRAYIGRRNANGSRAPARWVFDASVLEFQQATETEERNESWSGMRGLAATLKTSRSLAVSLTLGQLNTDNLALAIDGARVDLASGTVTAEPVGSVKPGDVVGLDFSAISTLVLTAATVALVENTDYTVNEATGIVTFLTEKAGITAAYQYAAHSVVTAFSSGSPDYYILFDGINTVDGASLKMRAEVHNIALQAANNFGLIQEGFGDIPLTGQAKIDPMRQVDPKWGGYARVVLIGGGT